MAFKHHSEICEYCHRPFDEKKRGLKSTRDHIIPKVLGDFGRHNILSACTSCNALKGARTPDELRALAAAMELQARLMRNMAGLVDEMIEDRGLIAPWLIRDE